MKMICHAVLVLWLFAVSIGSLMAAPGDSHWDRQFGLPGVNNRVYALRFNGDKLYASGYTIGAGGQVATNTVVDIFDGTNWSSALGELTGGLVLVYDVGFLGNDIYVGGIFSQAGGVTAPGFARWNGSDWSSLNFTGSVTTVVSDGSSLYVGGSFTNVGGMLITNVARFDGTNWYPLGGGLGYFSSLGSYVSVLELHNGLLYAGGVFTNAGNVAVTNLAVWDGSNWSAVGGGVNSSVSALAFHGDDLYVGGGFTAAGGVSALGIARWNGSTWSPLGAGCKGGGVSCIGILGSDVYVGGGFTNVGGVSAKVFAKWDGVTWTTWPTTDGVFQYPLNDTPNRMMVKDGSLYIGGIFNQAGGVIANHVVRYDSSNFYPVGEKPANGFTTPAINVASIGKAKEGIYVGGLFTVAGKTPANRIARFDGTNWFDVGGGTIGGTGSANRVLAIAGRGSDVFVGGTFTNVGGTSVNNVAKWNGLFWEAMGLGFDATVSVIKTSPSDVYVGGSFTNVSDPPFSFPVNRIARWDGLNWYSLGSGVTGNGTVSAIAVSGNKVYIGGSFTNVSGVTASRIAMWDGVSWSALGSGSSNGVNGTVLTIALKDNDVYVGGTFTNAGTTVVRGVAKWDGTSWSGLGSGASNSSGGPDVRSLAFGDDGKLYCSGRFTNMSGVSASSIARWDGTKWEALGSGFYGDTAVVRGTELVTRGNDVFVVGTFTGAGLADSSGIARWNETLDFTPPLTMNFSRPQVLPGNLFKSRFNCNERATYQIEYSDNFLTWTPLLTNSVPQLEFTNAAPIPANLRAFRAKSLP